MNTITCPNCGPVTSYYTMKDGSTRCADCQRERMRKYYKTDRYKELAKIRWRQKPHHGTRPPITQERYEEMLKAQNGVCAICQQPQARQSLAIDHNHKTGAIRGLLCNACNLRLGAFEGLGPWEELAKAYIEHHK